MRVALVVIVVLLGIACAYTTWQWTEVKTKVDVAESTASMYKDSYEAQWDKTAELEQTLELAADGLRERNDRIRDLEQQVQTAQRARFDFYYTPVSMPRRSLNELQTYLSMFNWIPERYSAGYFDCSEICAYMEWSLENVGFDTTIWVDDAFDGGQGHAWLSVGGCGFVEATVPRVILPGDRNFEAYLRCDYAFKDITEAFVASPGEFDWWVNWEKWTG